MIKQFSLLADIMKGIQEDKSRFQADEQRVDEEGVREPEQRVPSSTEHESGKHPVEQDDVRTVEAEPAREESQAEGEPTTVPIEGETPQEIPEGVNDGPQEKKGEVIERCAEFGATLFNLQARTTHELEGKMERLVSGVEKENVSVGKPPPVIGKTDGCCEEKGPSPEDERAEKGGVKLIYYKLLRSWPKPPKRKDPSDHGLRPKEKRKIQGTYKNHKKKRTTMIVMYPRKNRWVGRPASRKVVSGTPIEDNSPSESLTSELIKLEEKC